MGLKLNILGKKVHFLTIQSPARAQSNINLYQALVLNLNFCRFSSHERTDSLLCVGLPEPLDQEKNPQPRIEDAADFQ